MKVSEAKQKCCPYIDQKCLAGYCMAWVYTKELRERTYEENVKFEMYDKEDKDILRETGRLKFFDKEQYKLHLQKADDYLKEKYKDVIELNLELDEKEKEGYCKRLGQ